MENRSGLGQAQDQAKVGAERIKSDLPDRVGGWVAKLFTFAASGDTCAKRLRMRKVSIFKKKSVANANFTTRTFFFLAKIELY